MSELEPSCLWCTFKQPPLFFFLFFFYSISVTKYFSHFFHYVDGVRCCLEGDSIVTHQSDKDLKTKIHKGFAAATEVCRLYQPDHILIGFGKIGSFCLLPILCCVCCVYGSGVKYHLLECRGENKSVRLVHTAGSTR